MNISSLLAAGATSDVDSFPILSALILLPLMGSVLVMVMSNRRPEYVKMVAILFSVGIGAMSLWMLAQFDTSDGGFQFVSQHEWIASWGISWNLGVDGISLFLVVLTGILFPLVIAGIDPHHDEKRYFAWLLLLEAGVMGSFLSLDLFLFFIFFEIVLVPMYFLIGGWGYDSRVYAATNSSCTQCLAQHSCWWELLRPLFWHETTLAISPLT
jgi:NADH-quinone oxidoreductase subunit M